MKRIFTLALSALLLVFSLTACTASPAENKNLTPEERTQLYKTAIESARSEEENQYSPVLTDAGSDDAELLFSMLELQAEDLSAFALSISLMNVQAYGLAAIYPAEDKADAVQESLRSFIEHQKQNFAQYLEDQYTIASDARLETLDDGTILMVMCADQDRVFDSIRQTIEAGG